MHELREALPGEEKSGCLFPRAVLEDLRKIPVSRMVQTRRGRTLNIGLGWRRRRCAFAFVSFTNDKLKVCVTTFCPAPSPVPHLVHVQRPHRGVIPLNRFVE